MKKQLLTLLCCMVICAGYAQERQYYISDPLDINTTGWNKVLVMNNGNTVLLHVENDKPLLVKVFDSLHKQVASQKHICGVLDIHILKATIFKGFIDVGDEAVLFMEQERHSKHALIRLRLNAKNGKLIEEKVISESATLLKPTKTYVMKDKAEDGYAILFATDDAQFRRCDLHVAYYNAGHNVIREVPLEVDRKDYDSLNVVGADVQPNGIMVSVALAKLKMNGTSSDVSPQNAVYDYHLAMYYIPLDGTKAIRNVVDVSTNVYPYYAKYTYNAFARALNLFLFSYLPITYVFGVDIKRGAAIGNLFFRVDVNDTDVKFNWVSNKMANAYLKGKTDTGKFFYGIPLRMHTNTSGLTTVVTELFERYDEPETGLMYDFYNYFGNIAITQLDDDGNELWGTVLPHMECFKSNRQFYQPDEVARRYQSHNILDDLPEQSYERQFVSINPYFYGKDLYIIYNDYNKNFDNSISKPGDTVYTYNNTNACYYKLNGKKEVTKNYLFGTPGDAEFKTSFIEGADFDERKGVYVTLLQCWKHDNYTINMAWRRMD